VLRTVLYLFVIVDIIVWVNDVVPHGYAPRFYQPTFFPRLLDLPTPTPLIGQVLQVVLVGACLVAAAGRLPRAAGWVAAAAFQWWLFIGMSYGKVDHDHFALLVALWVLPTVGAARFTDRTPSEAAGWALRAIQVGVVATYFGSFFAKWVRSGSPLTWANSAIFTWAITRRGTDVGRLLLDYPPLLRLGQWGLLTAELLSPVVLFLRGRWLLLAAVFWLQFHLVTWLMIGIHFLPTVVCWLAFAPLERLVPARRADRQRLPAPVSAG
jgi:hypothetical protein